MFYKLKVSVSYGVVLASGFTNGQIQEVQL